jgi:hypothetical protein
MAALGIFILFVEPLEEQPAIGQMQLPVTLFVLKNQPF